MIYAQIHGMLGKGMDVDGGDSYGNTALMWAVRMDEVEAAKVLLDHGAGIVHPAPPTSSFRPKKV